MVIQNTMSKEITGLGRNLSVMAKIYTRKPTVCCSKGVMKDFVSLFSEYNLKKTCYIYSPIDAIFIKNMGCSLSSVPFKNYIIHVGKFSEQKRHDILIKAYYKSGVSEKLVLLTKGSITIEQKMKTLVKSLKIEDKVIFAGFKSNPYPYVKHAKLMALSSAYEGLPTVILESLVLGTPVISTDCESGPREILPQKNLTPVGDIDALSKKIRDAMKNIDNFKTNIDEVFLLERTTNKYLDLAE
jgi:glycosyltransferase involved in cell wall biosynthesis